MNKKGTMPDWLIALILAIAVLLIVLVFILGPYKEGISTYVRDNILGSLGGGR